MDTTLLRDQVSSRGIENRLHVLRVRQPPRVDDNNGRLSINRDRLVIDPETNLVDLKKMSNLIELFFRQYDVGSGCLIDRNANGFLRCRVGYRRYPFISPSYQQLPNKQNIAP